MDQILTDLQAQLSSYYESVIALLPKLAVAILVFSLLFFLANRSKRIVNRRLSSQMDDPLLAQFLSRVIRIAIIIVAVIIVLNIIGLSSAAGGLLAGAGVSAFVIGFAFKDIGENLLAGLMLAFNRPFRVGDTVELDNVKGKVITLNFRDTHIKTFDGKDIFVPNANIIKNPVVNYTIDGFLRNDFVVGLDYGSDIDKAQKIMMDILNSTEGVLQEDKKPNVQLTNLNTSTMDMTIYYWIDTFNSKVPSMQLKTTLMESIVKALEGEGYYLPGNIIELKNYKDLEIKSSQTETA